MGSSAAQQAPAWSGRPLGREGHTATVTVSGALPFAGSQATDQVHSHGGCPRVCGRAVRQVEAATAASLPASPARTWVPASRGPAWCVRLGLPGPREQALGGALRPELQPRVTVAGLE